MNYKYLYALFFSLLFFACANNNSEKLDNKEDNKTIIFKGLYSYGPEVRTFINCNNDINYWVVDSSKKLELAYTNFNFEKPYEPVYIEIEGHLKSLDNSTSQTDIDSTLVVTKVNIITKEIPDGPCSGN